MAGGVGEEILAAEPAKDGGSVPVAVRIAVFRAFLPWQGEGGRTREMNPTAESALHGFRWFKMA